MAPFVPSGACRLTPPVVWCLAPAFPLPDMLNAFLKLIPTALPTE